MDKWNFKNFTGNRLFTQNDERKIAGDECKNVLTHLK